MMGRFFSGYTESPWCRLLRRGQASFTMSAIFQASSLFVMADPPMIYESEPFTAAFATDFASGLARHPFGGFINHLSGGLVHRPSVGG